MPTYDYLCPNGHRLRGHPLASPPTVRRVCPICGAAPVRKAFSAPTIHFKGSGWAKKDRSTAARSASGRPRRRPTADRLGLRRRRPRRDGSRTTARTTRAPAADERRLEGPTPRPLRASRVERQPKAQRLVDAGRPRGGRLTCRRRPPTGSASPRRPRSSRPRTSSSRPSTIGSWARTGKLQSIKLGGRRFVRRGEVKALLAAAAAGPGERPPAGPVRGDPGLTDDGRDPRPARAVAVRERLARVATARRRHPARRRRPPGPRSVRRRRRRPARRRRRLQRGPRPDPARARSRPGSPASS